MGGITSCQTPAAQQHEPDVYYNVKGFVQEQIQLLSQQKPTVSKSMMVGDQREQRTTHEVNWQKELELFVQADINKPAYRASYSIGRPDSLTYEYTLKSEEDLPVRHLKVVLDRPSGKPALIEATILSENKLYESEKNLLLRSASQGGAWRVQSYRIQGFQELAISSRKPFDVQVTVQ